MKSARSVSACLCLAGLLVGAGAAAQPDPGAAPAGRESRYARVGLSGGLSASFVKPDFSVPGFRASDAGGLGVRIGYRSHEHLGFDFLFDWVSPIDVESKIDPRQGEVEMFFLSGMAKLYPFTGSLQPYLGAGLGMLIVRRDLPGLSRTGAPLAGRFGGGVDMYVNENVLLNLEAVYVPPFDGVFRDLDFALFQLGLQYRF